MIGEFIGNNLVVLECSAESFEGMCGKIIDETKNMLIIETNGVEKKIPKKCAVFEIGGKIVPGNKITFRAEDRPRKLKKKIR